MPDLLSDLPTGAVRISRRTLLRAAAAASAAAAGGALGAAPVAASTPVDVAAEQVSGLPAFVDSYRTNLTANLGVETNAAVRILSGMQRVWQTGTAWNTGTVLDAEVLRANVRYCARVTTTRTGPQAARAFVKDRQDQSYSAADGLGPLAGTYRAGALSVTSITVAPDTTPATPISDAVPAGAPAGAAIGAGSTASALGSVVTLVNTVRGPFASSNPSKFAFQYPRPWRMTERSTVVDTGAVDALGYPVYDSPVVVVPQLLRQRSTTPATDGGYPSGHTNAFHLAALAYAYAVPERFQELVTAAFDLSHTRIVAGMHSPVDVVSGRVLATALAAAALADPVNADLKAAARAQALRYLTAQVGGADLLAAAHDSTLGDDPYADREANRRLVQPKLGYDLPWRRGRVPMTVPKGAEVLLETRQPYLSAEQRREVLRTTALPSGHPLLDGPELWGRLDLFTAADGYGAFAADVVVTLDAAAGGLNAADTWRNDIHGPGGLVKAGSGTLTLTGHNCFRGGTTVQAGTLVAASRKALGSGPLSVGAGTLAVAARRGRGPLLEVGGRAVLGAGSTLAVEGAAGDAFVALHADRVVGRFGAVLAPAGLRARTQYSRRAVTVRLLPA